MARHEWHVDWILSANAIVDVFHYREQKRVVKSLGVWEAQGVGARGHHGEWAWASPREPATANQASSRPRLAHRGG